MRGFDGSSLNIVWGGVLLVGRCEVCGQPAAFEIEPEQRSDMMKHLLFKMVEKLEYGHVHMEAPGAQDKEGRKDSQGDEQAGGRNAAH